jgi:hypothetical protein
MQAVVVQVTVLLDIIHKEVVQLIEVAAKAAAPDIKA